MDLNALTNLPSAANAKTTAAKNTTTDSEFKAVFNDDDASPDQQRKFPTHLDDANSKEVERREPANLTSLLETEGDSAPDHAPVTPEPREASKAEEPFAGIPSAPFAPSNSRFDSSTLPTKDILANQIAATSNSEAQSSSAIAEQSTETTGDAQTPVNQLTTPDALVDLSAANESQTLLVAHPSSDSIPNEITTQFVSGDRFDTASQALTTKTPSAETPSKIKTLAVDFKANSPTLDSPIKSDLFASTLPSDPSNLGAAMGHSSDRLPVPAAVSLLDRHLGGLPVRILPQHLQPQAGKHDIGVASGTKINGTIMKTGPNGSAFNTAQTTTGLFESGDIKVLGFQTHFEFRPELTPNTVQDDVPQAAGLDLRTHTVPTNATLQAPANARPEMSTIVAEQIAEAIKASTKGSVEIALNPIELGRVRMVLSPSEAGLTLNILAERPDTLDLMRRNIDDLSRSFAELGYEDVSFSFEQNDQTADDSAHLDEAQDQMRIETEMSDAAVTLTLSPPRLAIAPDGIDMRL